MMDKLAYSVAGSGKPGFLAQWVPGLKIAAESPAPIHPEEGAVLVSASFTNPWKVPVTVKGLRLWHVTMGEMLSIPAPEKLKSLPGPAWLDPQGFSLQPGQTLSGRLAFGCKKYEVSLPCSLEATPSIGQPGRAGVLCVPLADLQKESAKKAKAPEAAS